PPPHHHYPVPTRRSSDLTNRHLLVTPAVADDCVHHVNAPSCDSELLYESSSLPGVTADLRPSTWSGPGARAGDAVGDVHREHDCDAFCAREQLTIPRPAVQP